MHNGHPMQFGATPNMGCADEVLSLKSMLQSRHEHGTDSFVVFADLVKACGSTRHNIVSATLVKMGAPPTRIEWVDKLNADFSVVLKLEK